MHGWPQSNYCWKEVATALPEFYVITPDLRGLGDSERTLAVKAYEKDAMGEDIFAVIAALGIDTFYLEGMTGVRLLCKKWRFYGPKKSKN